MAGNLCAALDALLQCLLGGGTASSVKYADRYETQLNKEIIDAETRMQTALQHAKDTTLHKSDRLKHFSSAKQLERQIQTKYQQLRILDQARFSKEENQNRRAFLAVIRKSKLPTIRQIEGTSEQVAAALICAMLRAPVSTNRAYLLFSAMLSLMRRTSRWRR